MGIACNGQEAREFLFHPFTQRVDTPFHLRLKSMENIKYFQCKFIVDISRVLSARFKSQNMIDQPDSLRKMHLSLIETVFT